MTMLAKERKVFQIWSIQPDACKVNKQIIIVVGVVVSLVRSIEELLE